MPYRDDDDVLHDRLDALREETERLERTLRDRGAAPRRLPLLDRVGIASPCSAAWDDMLGDARERLCGSCEKTVYNLSEMTRVDAEALLQERLGTGGTGACVRLYRRADGTILTADCPVGVRKKATKRRVTAAAGASLLAVGALAAAFRYRAAEDPIAPLPMMGAVAVSPPVPETGVAELPGRMEMGDVAVTPPPPSPHAEPVPAGAAKAKTVSPARPSNPR